jgi:hypothetical protein
MQAETRTGVHVCQVPASSVSHAKTLAMLMSGVTVYAVVPSVAWAAT